MGSPVENVVPILQKLQVFLLRLLPIGFSLLDVSHKIHIRSWIMQHTSQYREVGHMETCEAMEWSIMSFAI